MVCKDRHVNDGHVANDHVTEENYDVELHKASINITEVLATQLPGDSVLFTVSYEFMAQYADGQRWVKDTAIAVGRPSPDLLANFKRDLIGTVQKERRILRGVKLNGEAA